MKYMIHSYPKRMWYVENYLVPSLIEQGIKEENIYIFNDSNGRGNLQAYLDSLDYIINNLSDEEGLWHLQDDVIICRNFKEKTENQPKDKVVNGFVNKLYEHKELSGEVNVKNYWYSFPCVYIPNKYLKEFMGWVDIVKDKVIYSKRYYENRYDDYFFYKYLIKIHERDTMINLKPNLVDHIDYLLGGTTGTRRNIPVRALYFEDLDLVKKLERRVKNELSQTIQKTKKVRKEKS